MHIYEQSRRYNHKISSRHFCCRKEKLGLKLNDSSEYELAAVLGLVKHEWITFILNKCRVCYRINFNHAFFQYDFPFLQKQDEHEVAITCPESLINDKEPAESRTPTITPENKSPIMDIPIAPQNSEVESLRRTELADLIPRVKYYENPWLDPLIWEKICAPIETLSSQEDHCMQLSNQELKHEAHDLEPSSMWSKFSFATMHSSIST